MSLLVRTWNLFHGRTVPETDELHLEEMVRLISGGEPDVVALQEVPVWAVSRLAAWSGMRVVAATAMPPLAGPLARRLTALRPRRLRSSLTGQANALLLGGAVQGDGPSRVVRLNPRSVRRSHRVAWRQRADWARNRRICQLVPARVRGASLLLANLHASKSDELAQVELRRLATVLPEGPAVVCGDLNVAQTGLPGFSDPLPGIDQILVRGLALDGPPARWPADRRRQDGALLSDHAPVEASVGVGSPGP